MMTTTIEDTIRLAKAKALVCSGEQHALNSFLKDSFGGKDAIIKKGYIQGPKPREMKGRTARVENAYHGGSGSITLELKVWRKDGNGFLEGYYYCNIDRVEFKP